MKEKIKIKLDKVVQIIKHVFPNLNLEIAVVVCVIAIICLSAGIITTATISQEDELTNINQGQINQTEEDSTSPSFQVNATEPSVETQVVEFQPSQICFIGDSRTVNMRESVLTDAKFIAKSAMGLDWFNNTAAIEFDKIQNDIEICVVALGINDIFNVDLYIERLNKFAEEYPNKIFIYVNLGPVDESKYTGIPNSSLEQFNQKMADGLSDRWQVVDQYTYLSAESFSSSDGLHYSVQDSAKVFVWIIDSIKIQTITVAKN